MRLLSRSLVYRNVSGRSHSNFLIYKIQMHRTIGRYWAELARTLADSPVLPINVTRIAQEMGSNYVVQLKKVL